MEAWLSLTVLGNVQVCGSGWIQTRTGGVLGRGLPLRRLLLALPHSRAWLLRPNDQIWATHLAFIEGHTDYNGHSAPESPAAIV